MTNWNLRLEKEGKMILKSRIADDFMFYLVYNPYDGKHENCSYWLAPIIYVSDAVVYMAKTRMLYRSFKAQNFEFAINFAEERANSLILSCGEEDNGSTYSFNGYEDVLSWKSHPIGNWASVIEFHSKYKDEEIDITFAYSMEDNNPPIISIKNGVAINCEFEKLKETEYE